MKKGTPASTTHLWRTDSSTKDKVCVAARMGRRPKLEVIVDRAAVAERAAGSCGGVVALKITCHPSDALIN